MSQIRKRLTYANVMSSIAIFFVLGGGAAYAAKKIGSNQLKANSVTTAKIKKNAVTSKKIKNGSVTTAKLANNAVIGSKVADGSLSSADLSDLHVKGLTKVAATAGATEEEARAAAPPVQLFSNGPLSVYVKCFTDSSEPRTYAEVYAATTEAGSVFVGNSDSLYGDPFLEPTTKEDERQIYTQSTGENDANGWRTIFQISAPGGTSLAGEVALFAKNGTLTEGQGVYGAGDACLFSGYVTS